MASYDFSAPRLFVEPTLAADRIVPLDKAQQTYLCAVLRLSEGEPVLIFNGRDGEWRADLTPGAGRKQMALRVAAQTRPQTAPGIDLHYLFAPLKHARLDYMVQKAVEMGANALRPVQTRRTQAARLKVERMRANAIEAAEQCGILALPQVADLAGFDEVFAAWPSERVLLFFDEDAPTGGPLPGLAALPRGAPLAVIVGPEGGFDPVERQALLALPNVVRLSLGPRILRADTAAVAALALVQASIGDW